jgi:two-component system, LytTR family, sensor kinase
MRVSLLGEALRKIQNVCHFFFVPTMLKPVIPRQLWSRISVHCAVWALCIVVIISLQRINGASLHLGRTMVILCCAIGGYYLNTRVLVERYFQTQRYGMYALFVISAIATSVTLNACLEYYVWGGYVFTTFDLQPRRYAILLVWISMGIVFVGLFLTTQRVHRQRELETQQLLTQHKEAELQFLRSQINPHFLFNTLNNIYALAVAQSPQTAPMLMRLSKLLRYAIYTSQRPMVALQEEISEIHELLTLFQLRSDEQLRISFTTCGQINGQCIEPMVLFSLVENCLKHSDIDYNALGFIDINLAAQDDTLFFSTLNTKDTTNRQKDETGGVGLYNIRQRLALKYDSRASLIINDSPTRFEALLTLPLAMESYELVQR